MQRRGLVHLDGRALSTIVGEALSSSPLETGGLLLGRASDTNIVIRRVIGPGPHAVHKRTAFDPDNGWQQEQLDTLFGDHPGEFLYLGDWHSHPGGSPRPSPVDVRAARVIAGEPDALQPAPLSLILGIGFDGRIRPMCYRLERGRLRQTTLTLLNQHGIEE